MLIILKEEGKNRVKICEFSLAIVSRCFRSKLSNCYKYIFWFRIGSMQGWTRIHTIWGDWPQFKFKMKHAFIGVRFVGIS